jgi:hypothetical protein
MKKGSGRMKLRIAGHRREEELPPPLITSLRNSIASVAVFFFGVTW